MSFKRYSCLIRTLIGLAASLTFAGLAEAQVVQLGPPASNNYPIVISQSGSYQLIANLAPSGNQDGIDVTADNVTLDLNGFAIVASGGGRGIGVSSSNLNVSVINGTIQDLQTAVSLGDDCGVRDVRVLGASSSFGSAGGAIRCGQLSAIEGVLVDNGGIASGAGSRIRRSTSVGGLNLATNTNNPSLICKSGCFVSDDIFQTGAVQLGTSGYADIFLGPGGFLVGGVNRD